MHTRCHILTQNGFSKLISLIRTKMWTTSAENPLFKGHQHRISWPECPQTVFKTLLTQLQLGRLSINWNDVTLDSVGFITQQERLTCCPVSVPASSSASADWPWQSSASCHEGQTWSNSPIIHLLMCFYLLLDIKVRRNSIIGSWAWSVSEQEVHPQDPLPGSWLQLMSSWRAALLSGCF